MSDVIAKLMRTVVKVSTLLTIASGVGSRVAHEGGALCIRKIYAKKFIKRKDVEKSKKSILFASHRATSCQEGY